MLPLEDLEVFVCEVKIVTVCSLPESEVYSAFFLGKKKEVCKSVYIYIYVTCAYVYIYIYIPGTLNNHFSCNYLESSN